MSTTSVHQFIGRDGKPATDLHLGTEWNVDFQLLDLLPVAVYFCDAEGVLVHWNQCATELWGRTPVAESREKFCGSFRLLRPDGSFLAHADCPMAEALRTGLPQQISEGIMERPDGSRRFFMATIEPIRNKIGLLVGAVNVVQDITERKRAEDARVQTEARFRRLLENLPAAAYTCDSDGLITYYNASAEELWGRAPKLNDPEDRFCGSFRLFGLDGLPICHDQCWMALALKNHRKYEGKEIFIERPDGSRRAVLAYATPFSDESGALPGAVNVLVDITERNRSQDTINRLLAREREQSDQLKEAARRKDEFLAMLAHELRNPLAPICTGLELLAIGEKVESDTLNLMRRQVNHLVRLVDDLLDVSRIVRGRIELRRELIELATLFQQSVDAVRPAFESRKHELIVRLPQESVWINADAVRLNQVFENLLHNACKYTDEGGRIEFTAQLSDQRVCITVQDNGVGIEPHLLSGIFDLFTQSNRSLDRAQGGLGIGLTLVKDIVEMHGGFVTAYSGGLGQGSRLVVELPVVSPPVQTSLPTAIRQTSAAGRRILVVEDNVGTAKILSKLLANLGPHEIHMAHDGLMALEIAEAFRPEIILLDIGLPKMHGFDVASALRENHAFAQTLLVALTGYGQEQDRQRSQEAGFDLHFVKPVDLEMLRDVLCHPKLTVH